MFNDNTFKAGREIYKKINEKTCALESYGSGKIANIPQSVQDINDMKRYDIISILTKAFEYEALIEHLSFDINSHISQIQESAFSCFSLKSIIFPKSIRNVDENAFYCSCIETIDIHQDNKHFIKDSAGIIYRKCPFSVFFAPKRCATIVVRQGVVSIFSASFCKSLIRIVHFPSSLKRINTLAFASCKNLNKVTFEKESSLEIIDSMSFKESGLKSITIPSSVTYIGSQSFFMCRDLRSVKINIEDSRLDEIGSLAFSYSSIKSMNIPNNTTKIRTGAFSSCSSLESITFGSNSKLNMFHRDAFDLCPRRQIKAPPHLKEFIESLI